MPLNSFTGSNRPLQRVRRVSVDRATDSPAREKCRPYPPHGQTLCGNNHGTLASTPEELLCKMPRFPRLYNWRVSDSIPK
jgi:hypothetical protein